MINKLIELVKENRRHQKEIIKYSRENNWANVYHDSIRGTEFLNNLSLNIGRWSGNYAFFYIMNRLLNDYPPTSILELGLGESTKFITTFLKHKNPDCFHLVIEEDITWREHFYNQIDLYTNTQVKILETQTQLVEGFETKIYKNIEHLLTDKFDIYIIDGPKGSSHFSRYDLTKIAATFSVGDEFILVIDDYDRAGEKETVEITKSVLNNKGIKFYEAVYYGLKNVLLIATEKYKYCQSF